MSGPVRSLLRSADSSTAVVTRDGGLDHTRLGELVGERSAGLAAAPPGLVMHFVTSSIEGIVGYVASFDSGRPVALVDPESDPAVVDLLVERYRPAVVSGAVPTVIDGYRASGPALVRTSESPPVDPDLGVLLPTSGSTGSPKMVRLSRGAVVANAEAIARSLGIEADDRAPLNLPLHYSYGLSVLNSHLVAGASVVPTSHGFLQREFWATFDSTGCTSLAGVPYAYQMLRRIRFDPGEHPSLRSMTQAGGKLADDLVEEFHGAASAAGARFYVMYGQTEATARMAVLPPEELPRRLGSAGRAIPGGSFEIVEGEVVYSGPNVMMGYAESAEDLARPDELGGRLHTGDLGRLDEDGYLWLTGRAKRIGKVFGTRVSLDDIEAMVAAAGPSAAAADGDRVVVFLEAVDQALTRQVVRELAGRLHLPVSGFEVRLVNAMPRRGNGKTDYAALQEML